MMDSPKKVPSLSSASFQSKRTSASAPLAGTQLRHWSRITRLGVRNQRTSWTARRIIGPLHVDVLRDNLDVLVHRHEALRTRVTVDDGIPRQLIAAEAKCALEVVDLSNVEIASRESELARLCTEFLVEDVDLTVGPLLAVRLFRLSLRESILIIARDALITDRASSAILHRELWHVYEQALRSKPFHLPKLPLQFADYAAWQDETRACWSSYHEPYWRASLTGARSIVIPRDRPIAEGGKAIFETARFSFNAKLTDQLRTLAWKKRTVLPVVVLCIYAVVISRWCRRSDIVVTFISHGRQRSELQGMIGLLANLARLRLQVEDDVEIERLIGRTHTQVRAALEHEDCDWSYQLMPEPESDVVFNWVPEDDLGQLRLIAAAGDVLSIAPYKLNASWEIPSFFPFLPQFQERQAEVVIDVTFRRDAFVSETIAQFGDDMVRWARRFVEQALRANSGQ